MKKISILGHFGNGEILLNGQTVKTKIVTEELENRFGKDEVIRIDTHGGWKTLLKAPFQAFKALKNSENVVIFPAHNGLRVYAPLLSFQKCLFSNRKLHYVVIGGWLPQFLSNRKGLAKKLKKFEAIYVETTTMKNALEKQGFENIVIMPHFKKLTAVSENELIYSAKTPYRLCTFSRVIKEKGIETAVDVIHKVNNELGYSAYSLDIYGQVDSEQAEWFDILKQKFSQDIRYCGCVDADKSVGVLKNYFVLLFPTHFYTEGIPGTIVDAYAAGIPVVSARWESFSDVVDEGMTGIGYDFDRIEQFEEILLNIAENPEIVLDMKKNCIQKVEQYAPESAIRVLVERLS